MKYWWLAGIGYIFSNWIIFLNAEWNNKRLNKITLGSRNKGNETITPDEYHIGQSICFLKHRATTQKFLNKKCQNKDWHSKKPWKYPRVFWLGLSECTHLWTILNASCRLMSWNKKGLNWSYAFALPVFCCRRTCCPLPLGWSIRWIWNWLNRHQRLSNSIAFEGHPRDFPNLFVSLISNRAMRQVHLTKVQPWKVNL